MTLTDFFLVLIFLSPFILSLILWFKFKKNRHLIIRLGSSKIILRKNGIGFLFILLPLLLIALVIPFFNFFAFILILLLLIFLSVNGKKYENTIPNQSSEVLEDLKKMSKKIHKAIEHLEIISLEIKEKTSEINSKTIRIEEIENDINKKTQEYEAWKKLTKSEKGLLVSAVDESINSKKSTRIFWFVVGTIVLNITSTLIWVLMGVPGKKELLNLLNLN